ncbi:MAG: helix-turn-helix domain-containing protein [Erysipelotrichales bacterium]|nr:helix-turn-helix domain-containing protein [Erysipelotrichales bacterium]
MDFSEKLKELRKQKGITQEELAKNIFISRSVIAKYESGVSIPTKENAKKIAEFFDVKLSYLIDEEEHLELTLAEVKTRKIVFYIVSSLGVLINSLYIIICAIPIFTRFRYIYPIPDGMDQPPKENVQNSVMSATLRNKNPMGIITLVFCVLDFVLFILMLIKTNKKKSNVLLDFSSIILLVINVFLIFVTVIMSASYSL